MEEFYSELLKPVLLKSGSDLKFIKKECLDALEAVSGHIWVTSLPLTFAKEMLNQTPTIALNASKTIDSFFKKLSKAEQ